MGVGINQRGYTPEELKRNRGSVVSLACVAIVVLIVGATAASWSVTSLLSLAAVFAVTLAALWWLFASKRAGYLEGPTNPDMLEQTFGRRWR